MADFTPDELAKMNADPPIISPGLRRKIAMKKTEANLAAGRGVLYTGDAQAKPPLTEQGLPAPKVVPPVQPDVRPEGNAPQQPVVMLDEQLGNLLTKAAQIEGQLHAAFGTVLAGAQTVVARTNNQIMTPVAKGVGDALATVTGVDQNLDVQLTQQAADLAQNFQNGFGVEGQPVPGNANGIQPVEGGQKTAQVRARLVAAYGLTAEQAAREVVAEDRSKLAKITLKAGDLDAPKMVMGPDGKEYRQYAPSRMLGEFTTDDQSYAQCTLPYKPVLDTWSGNVVCMIDGTEPPKPVSDLGPQSVYKPQTVDTPSKPSSDCEGAQKVWICNLPDMKPPEDKKPPEKCDPKKWQLLRTREGVCYVIPEGEQKRSSDDDLVTQGEFSQDWVDRIASQCGTKRTENKPDDSQGASSPKSTSLDSCTSDGVLTGLLGANNLSDLLKGFGIDFAKLIVDNTPGTTDWVTSPVRSGLKQFFKTNLETIQSISNIFNQLLSFLPCGEPAILNETTTLIAANLSKLLGGDALDPWSVPIKYDRDSRCPFLLPSASEAVGSYMANTINSDRLKCLVTANGLKWDQYLPVIEANRSRHSPLDLVSLYRRGTLNEAQYQQRIRELGFLWPNEAKEIIEVTKPLPGPADIVRFMLRDVVNEGVVTRFGLGKGFGENFTGKLKEYADFQGLDSEQMDLYWKAHWSIPSPTQLYEMYRRLRHSDRVGGEAQLVADIKMALVQQDILPFWQDDLLKLATLPLNRTDSKRAYEINAIDTDQLRQSFYAGGYSDKDTEILVKFTQKQKRLKFARHPAVAKYSKGLIGRDELTELLIFEGAEQADIDYATTRGKLLARSNMRDKCGQAVKRRFLLAEIDSGEISTKLVQLGIDPDIAASLSGAWQCERSARGKQLPLMRLSKLYRQGIIKADEFTRRMVTLGYDPEQAMYILQEQDGLKDEEKRKKDEAKAKAAALKEQKRIAEQKKLEKEQIAQNKAMTAAEKAAAKEAQAAFEKGLRAEEKAQKQAQAALTKAQAVIHDREDNLLDIAASVAKLTSDSMGNALRGVRACFNSLKRSGKGVDSVLDIGVKTAKLGGYEEVTQFCQLWQTAVDASVGVESQITPTT